MPKEVDAITKLYDFLLWIIPKLEKFPRSQKFLINFLCLGRQSLSECPGRETSRNNVLMSDHCFVQIFT